MSFFSSYYFFTVHAVSSGCRNIYLFRRNSRGFPKSHVPIGKRNAKYQTLQSQKNNSTRKQAQGFLDLLETYQKVVNANRFCTGGVGTGAVERDSSPSFPLSPGQSRGGAIHSPLVVISEVLARVLRKSPLLPNCKLRTKELHVLLQLNYKNHC